MKHYPKIFVLDGLTLVCSVAAGLVWFGAGELLYRTAMRAGIVRPAIIGGFFGVGALILLLALLYINKVRSQRRIPEKSKRTAIIMVAVILLVAAVFEAIYDIEIHHKTSRCTGVVFLIDDSGSMADSDRSGTERETAIKTVMNGVADKNLPFCVYSFNDTATRLCAMRTAGEAEQMHFAFECNNGTDYVTALYAVLDDLDMDVIDAGAAPAIVFVSDGKPNTTYGLDEALNDAVSKNIVIHTIGLGGLRFSVLKMIAEKTDGLHMTIRHIDELTEAMTAAVQGQGAQRTLVSYRIGTRYNALYCAERIVFLLLLGAAFLVLKLAAINYRVAYGDELLLWHCVSVVLGVLAVEAGMNLLRFPQPAMRAVLCVGFAAVVLAQPVYPTAGGTQTAATGANGEKQEGVFVDTEGGNNNG